MRDPDAANRQFQHILGVVTKAAQKRGWTVRTHAALTNLFFGKPTAEPEADDLDLVVHPTRPPFFVPDLTDAVLATFFAGIYEREPHIRLIHDAVQNHVVTLEKNAADPSVEVCRSHILLKGKPAGAKTTLDERFKAWYEHGGDTERITFVDMQSATRAGLENWLLDQAEMGKLADIVVLEEIEKVKPLDNLLPLVSLMGSGYVAKLNARVGRRKELANVLVLATCNNEHLVRTWNDGVLWSRFAHKLHCTRPGRELIRIILLDKTAKARGDPAWVEKAVEFAFDIYPQVTGRPMDDPREVRGLLDGKDRLLDGSYQRDILAILKAEAAERRAESRHARWP